MKKSLENLVAFSDNLGKLEHNQEFLKAFSEDTGYSIPNIKKREIHSSKAFMDYKLEEIQKKVASDKKFYFHKNKHIHKVFCLLPGNAALYAFCAKVLVPAVICDVSLSISFPSRLRKSKEFLVPLFEKYLPNIKILETKSKSELFHHVINETDIDTVVVFASDVWISEYIGEFIDTNKRLIFEGPGNDPCVVFEDYDKKSVKDIVQACLNNYGQSCSSLKRVYVKEAIHDEFVYELIDQIDQHIKENPDANNSIFSSIVFDKINYQITEAKGKGAKVVYGDAAIKDSKFNPTILLSPNHTTLVLEENFYPVIPVVKFKDEKHVETLIFESNYGLNCSIFGNYSEDFLEMMKNNHKSVFKDSTIVNHENHHEITKLGGYRRSGYILEDGIKKHGSFYLEDLIFRDK
ncbi:aldehyde dehydrogenase family protein [Aureivirga sp. CE67]|uniref:aldehyde dehydrogenase family protein n=1 Tax=Aureivirga sp. CE67 TaxID=1788983 RepID=UPI0018C94FC9|nr:aldehyde dehydrogenase family protein [Aureivirga sp. CE67]